MRLLVIALLLLPFSLRAQTPDLPHLPMIVLDEGEGAIALIGEIDRRTPLAFERVVAEVGTPRILHLRSYGGSVHASLAVAMRVHALGITTVITSDSECLSACAFIFFAGQERIAEGALGLHQFNSDNPQAGLSSAQFTMADILDALLLFDVSPVLIGHMMRTPPEDMYIVSRSEKREHGLLALSSPAPRAPAAARTPAQGAVTSLTDPSGWRGKMITGALLSDGRRWFAWLMDDGSSVFQTSNAERLWGRYRISKGAVCFLHDQNEDWACRWPTRRGGRVYWEDTSGNAISRIVSVTDTPISAVSLQENVVADVAKVIPVGLCALIVSAHEQEWKARAWVLKNVEDRRNVRAFRSPNGWISVSVGNLRPDDVDRVVADWKASGRIPRDSYCTTGTKFTSVVDLGKF